MKKLIRSILIALLTLAFLYLGGAFVLTPIPSLQDEPVLLTIIRFMGIVWFFSGIWVVINFRKIIQDI